MQHMLYRMICGLLIVLSGSSAQAMDGVTTRYARSLALLMDGTENNYRHRQVRHYTPRKVRLDAIPEYQVTAKSPVEKDFGHRNALKLLFSKTTYRKKKVF